MITEDLLYVWFLLGELSLNKFGRAWASWQLLDLKLKQGQCASCFLFDAFSSFSWSSLASVFFFF